MTSIYNTTITTIVVVFSLFLFIVLANTIVYAQQVSPTPSNTPTQKPGPSSSLMPFPKLHAVKIISPTKGQQIPASKDLTISGTSIDNATSNCQVSMNVNRVKPYQPTTAAGTGGANDYSKWNFLLTSNYTTIKPGPDNRITAKYTCTDNPAMVSPTYSSVNVTGVMDSTSTTTTPAANVLLQQQKQQTMTTSNNATIINNGNPNKITPQGKPLLSVGNNNTPLGNSVSTPAPSTASTPTKTPGSGELLYLGINSKSANKADDTNTKSTVAHHSSSNDNNSFATSTKTKTQHTSSISDKSSKATATIDEHHGIKPVNSKSKTSHNNGRKSKDIGEHINSKFGDSDPLSNALDHMSDTLDHLFG